MWGHLKPMGVIKLDEFSNWLEFKISGNNKRKTILKSCCKQLSNWKCCKTNREVQRSAEHWAGLRNYIARLLVAFPLKYLQWSDTHWISDTAVFSAIRICSWICRLNVTKSIFCTAAMPCNEQFSILKTCDNYYHSSTNIFSK